MQPNVTQGQATEAIILWVFTVVLAPVHFILLRYGDQKPQFWTHFSDGLTRFFLSLFFLAVVAAGVLVFFCKFAQEHPAAVFHSFAGAQGAMMFAWNRYMVLRSPLPLWNHPD